MPPPTLLLDVPSTRARWRPRRQTRCATLETPQMRPSSSWCGLVVRVRDQLCAFFAKQVDAAHVVHVALCEQDVAHRTAIHGVEVPLVDGRLETHPGIDHDAPFRRDDQIRIGEPLRQINEIRNLLRFGLRGGLDLKTARTRSIQGCRGHRLLGNREAQDSRALLVVLQSPFARGACTQRAETNPSNLIRLGPA